MEEQDLQPGPPDPGPDGAEESVSATEAGQRAAQLREFFGQFRKTIKNIGLYRHNPVQHEAFVRNALAPLTGLLEQVPSLTLRVEARAFSHLGQRVYEEEADEHNLALRFYRDGVRVLTLRQGLTAEELKAFALVCLSAPRGADQGEDDLASLMWKQDFQHIEHVIMDSFAFGGQEAEGEQAQVEVGTIVDHLYQRMTSTSQDAFQFARVSLDDLELELKDISQVAGLKTSGLEAAAETKASLEAELAEEDAVRLLPRVSEILVELFEEEPDLKLAELLESAFLQILDSLLLAGSLEAVNRLVTRLDELARAPLPPGSLAVAGHIRQRIRQAMAEPERLARVADVLDSNPAPEILTRAQGYLACLDARAIQPLLEALERLQRPEARRLVCERLVAFGDAHLPEYQARLESPKPNLVRDMLWLLTQLAPGGKTALMAGLLGHPNLALRLEALRSIGDGADPGAGPLVVRALKDPDSQVRTTAYRLLLNFDPTVARRTLMAVVELPAFAERPAQEQSAAIAALAMSDAPEALEHFRAELGRSSVLHKKQFMERKRVLVQGLVASGSITVYRLLAAELKAGALDQDTRALVERAVHHLRERLLGKPPPGEA
jgi:hypothetical protein